MTKFKEAGRAVLEYLYYAVRLYGTLENIRTGVVLLVYGVVALWIGSYILRFIWGSLF